MSNNSESNYLLELNEYRNILFNKKEGAPGRNYLKIRGLTKETAEFWNLGYCPIGFTPSIYKNNQYVQKKMHGRLIIPVFDQNGKLVTISGRKVFDTLPGPKYDMYPFAARKILFGLWQNKNEMRNQNRAAITEGQIDVITSWQQGFKIVSSSFGAHGSLDHLALLARYAKKINVLYDSDKAGFEGINAIKGLSILCDLDIEFKNPFPKGEDLDSWIKKNSSEKLIELLDKSKTSDLMEKLKKIEGRIR